VAEKSSGVMSFFVSAMHRPGSMPTPAAATFPLGEPRPVMRSVTGHKGLLLKKVTKTFVGSYHIFSFRRVSISERMVINYVGKKYIVPTG